jgi:hypothetical protein
MMVEDSHFLACWILHDLKNPDGARDPPGQLAGAVGSERKISAVLAAARQQVRCSLSLEAVKLRVAALTWA